MKAGHDAMQTKAVPNSVPCREFPAHTRRINRMFEQSFTPGSLKVHQVHPAAVTKR